MVEHLVNFAVDNANGRVDSLKRRRGALEQDEWAAQLVISLVACVTDTEASAVCSARRGHERVSCARQVCMYLLHTWFGLSYKRVGEIFARDRTTVAHACRQIEMHRDGIGIDRSICRLESLLELIVDKNRPTQ